MEIRGFEPLTLGLQSRCSSQLSYIPAHANIKIRERKIRNKGRNVFLADNPASLRCTPTLHYLSLRKEVIQPHFPVRLPCYDFTPLTKHTFDSVLLAVRLPASGILYSDGVTGGVYKARERIHRTVLMCDY